MHPNVIHSLLVQRGLLNHMGTFGLTVMMKSESEKIRCHLLDWSRVTPSGKVVLFDFAPPRDTASVSISPMSR
jgi:hypothetical protein